MAYAGYLKSAAVKLGIKTHQTLDIAVERNSAGDIAALVLDGKTRIEGQLFVDATGEDASLIGKPEGDAWESWRPYFNVDRVLFARAPSLTSIPAFAEVRVAREGWTALHPCRAATGIVHAYSAALQSGGQAVAAASAAAGVQLADVVFHAVNPGIRTAAWQGNCVSIGAAACAVDPIHDASLHIAQLGIVQLLSLFPVTEEFSAERTEYNRVVRSFYERVRDFQSAFYALGPFEGEFWDRARALAVPKELAYKIATFRARADLAPTEDETFLPDSWHALFLGLGVVPESCPPSINRITQRRLDEKFRRILSFIKEKVLEQPTHGAYLERLCGSLHA